MRGALVCALLAALAAAAPAGEAGGVPGTLWTSQRGGPEGRAACRWPQAGGGPAPAVAEWQFWSRGGRRYRAGQAVWGSPALAVVDGRPMAFIGGYDQTLHALDLAGRRERWAMITNGAIGDAPAVGLAGSEQAVFWGAADRTVYARRARDGRALWSRELSPGTSTMGPAEVAAPLFRGGTLYVSCFVYDRARARNDQKGWLFALDAADGRELWRFEASQGPVGAPAGAAVGGRLLVFVAARKGLLWALDVSGGRPEVVWTRQMAHEVMGSPVLDLGGEQPLLFLGSKFGRLDRKSVV